MKFTFKWLKDFLETDHTAAQIAEKLTSIGFEIESMVDRSEDLKAFEVAHIISADKHPDADKLRICKVETKDGEKQIVCGAPNARAGIKVVLAPVGVLIPNGKFIIREAEIRGQKSSGMMCSREELLIPGDSSGIIELPESAKVGDEIAQYFGLDDIVIEISVTPNRGDMLGVYGIARDLAAAGMGKLKYDLPDNPSISFSSSKNEGSKLFVTREISGLKNPESPLWLKHYLENIGVGSISAIVDITNYICHAFGRPMHAYDKSKISGYLKVDYAKNGEQFLALSGKEYKLMESDLVIRDDKEVQALAGIIGGVHSSCNDDTSEIILESALFDKVMVAKTGRRTGIETDSRYRFERSTDPMMVIPAIEMATELVLKICGGKADEIKAVGIDPKVISKHDIVTVKLSDIENRIGIKIDKDLAVNILKRLGFNVDISGDEISAMAPSWRHDISIKEDLIEEIVRIYGFENIPATPIFDKVNFRLASQLLSRSIIVKRIMSASGFDEVITFSFMNSKDAELFVDIKESLRLQNPISTELDYMRPSIIPNLLDAIVKNRARSINDLALFEVGPVFDGTDIKDERLVCSAVICGDYVKDVHAGSREVDIFDAKSVFGNILAEFGFLIDRMQLTTENIPKYLHPMRSAAVMLGKNKLGWFGEIHPELLEKYDIRVRVVAFELDISAIPEARLKYGRREEFVVSYFQPVTRDFAFVIDKNVAVGQILTFVAGIDKKLIRNVELFDIYEGDNIQKGKKSIALKLLIQSNENTLSEEDLIGIQNSVINAVKDKFDAVLRV